MSAQGCSSWPPTIRSVRNDFSLWRCLVRELAYELLGLEESSSDGQPVHYQNWRLAAVLAAQQRGAFHVSCLCMGVDPLTLATGC